MTVFSSVSLQAPCIQLVIIFGFFFSLLRENPSSTKYMFGMSVLGFSPLFSSHFRLYVCIYIDRCLLSAMYVCAFLPTPFSAGEQEHLWRPTNEQLFKGNSFYYIFVFSFVSLFFSRLSVLLHLRIKSPNASARNGL